MWLASLSREIEGLFSTLEIDSEAPSIKNLTFLIDFGKNYSGDRGFQEYSTGNGKIKNLLLKSVGDAQVLTFSMETDDFVIEAELSMTVQDSLGLRFVGDITAHYPDDSTREGIMKMELDEI